MNKLTAEVARMDIGHLREHQANPHVGLSMREEKYLQALEIALPVLEQQEKGGWIKHDGNNRPLGLRKNDLVYLNLKKQPIRIPYPAGMVNWKQTGSDFDVLEWKRAEGELPQADAYIQKEKAAGKHQKGE